MYDYFAWLAEQNEEATKCAIAIFMFIFVISMLFVPVVPKFFGCILGIQLAMILYIFGVTAYRWFKKSIAEYKSTRS